MQHRQFRQRLTWMSPTRSNRQRDGWKPVPKSSREHNVINIRPAVSVYATYRRLSYRTWGAVAEFVDNSTQNYYDHRKDLLRVYRRESHLPGFPLHANYDRRGVQAHPRKNLRTGSRPFGQYVSGRPQVGGDRDSVERRTSVIR